MDYKKTSERIQSWMREKTEQASRRGLVFGMSGGIDSGTLAALASRAFDRENILGVIMPCHSNPQDAEDAHKVAEVFDIRTRTVDLDNSFDTLMKALPEDGSQMARANIKPRLRMTTLYYLATNENFLVSGTDNRSELAIGYFTKYGDGGVDIIPLGDLLKTQIRELARHLGVPKEIIEKPPSAGLWSGQTDEEELDISYEKLDGIIQALGENRTPDAEPATIRRVRSMMEQAAHKVEPPPVCKLSSS